ncbi:MAG: exodeoxyribonuclease VII small subunit [Gemmatimonadales bacterium]
MSDTPTLGQDLARLEEIVRKLEDDDLALEAALQLFEEGVARLKTAQSRLAVAEARVMQVLQDTEQANGLRLEPLDG